HRFANRVGGEGGHKEVSPPCKLIDVGNAKRYRSSGKRRILTAKTMKKEENSDIHFVVRYSKKKYSKIFITLLVLLGSSLFLAYLWKNQAGSDFFFNVTVKVGLIYCIVELVKHLLYLFPKVKIVDVLISF